MANKMTQAQLQAERKQRDAVIAKMAQADNERQQIHDGRAIDRGLIEWWN